MEDHPSLMSNSEEPHCFDSDRLRERGREREKGGREGREKEGGGEGEREGEGGKGEGGRGERGEGEGGTV